MGGEGPAIRFNSSDLEREKYLELIGLKALDGEAAQQTYDRAKEFFLAKKQELLVMSSSDNTNTAREVCESEKNAKDLFILSGTWYNGYYERNSSCTFSLPTSTSSFVEYSSKEKWGETLLRTGLGAKRNNRVTDTIHATGPGPLCDIFYMLQMIFPGMLLLYRIEEYDEGGEQEYVRVLPSIDWIQTNEAALKRVFNNDSRLSSLCEEAKKRAIYSEWITHYSSSYDRENSNDYYTTSYGFREPKDYTACDAECGYCGTCDY